MENNNLMNNKSKSKEKKDDLNNNYFIQKRQIYHHLNNNNKNLKFTTDNTRFERYNQTLMNSRKNFRYIQSKNNEDLKSESINLNINKILNTRYQNTEIKENNEDEFETELLNVFIYIYYYEKSLKEKNIFNNNEKYYLINPDWLNKFKALYSYDKIKELLETKKAINYVSIDSKIDNIINILLEKVKLEKKPLKTSFKEIIASIIQIDSNNYCINNGIIFPSKIMDIIKNIYPEFKSFKKKNIYFKDIYIYYINNIKIIVGIFNNNAFFIPIYVFVYNSLEIEEVEEDIMISTNIKEYLLKRNCDIKSSRQTLKNEKGEEIGSLYILFKNIPKNNIKKKCSSNLNDKNNEIIKSLRIDNDKKFHRIEKNYQKKSETEFNNNENNNNIPLKNKEKKIQKEDPLLLNNNFINKLEIKNNYNNLLTQSQNEIINKINILENEFKTNEKIFPLFQNKVEELEKIKNDFSNLDKRHKNLVRKYQILQKENVNMIKEKEQINKNLKEYKEKILEQKYLIEQNINQINMLKKELQNKDENIKFINKELDKITSEKNDVLISKNSEINSLKEEISILKKNEEYLLFLKTNITEMKKKFEHINDIEKEKNNINRQCNSLLEKNKVLEKQNIQIKEDYKKLSEKINEEHTSNQKDLINIKNNFEKQINDLNQILKLKDEKIENIKTLNKQEINKIKNEKDKLENTCKEKENKINELVMQLNQKMVNDKIKLQTIQKKEKEISKRTEELNKKEKNLTELIDRHKCLNDTNISLEKNITDLKNQKDKLINDIKKYEELLKRKKEILKKIEEEKKINSQEQNNINKFSNLFHKNNEYNNDINITNEQYVTQNSHIQINSNKNISPNQNSLFIRNNIYNNISYPKFSFNKEFDIKNSNNNHILSFNEINIIKYYSKPPLIGLTNIGSSSYKNSVLQCLSQTSDLSNYFLNENNKERIMNNNIAKKNKNDLQLCPIYYNLIKNLWNKNEAYKSFSPENFLISIGIMIKSEQGQFTLHEKGEVQDFIIFILERMHKELKEPKYNRNNISFNQINPENPLNCYNRNSAFNHFINEPKNERSIISDIFFGFNESTNICQYCKNNYNSKGQSEPICYNYGIFNIFIFPLEEVRKFRNQFFQVNDSNMITLSECFSYSQKSELFTGNNQNYCNICRQYSDSVNTSKIFVSPKVLILLFNRGNLPNINIDFRMELNIDDFVICKDKNETYNLYGVVSLIEDNEQNGHFVATCKSPIDGIWYRYNDEIVEPVNDFQKDVRDFGTTYILFYEKQK